MNARTHTCECAWTAGHDGCKQAKGVHCFTPPAIFPWQLRRQPLGSSAAANTAATAAHTWVTVSATPAGASTAAAATPTMSSAFYAASSPEPPTASEWHAKRRRDMLAKHPELEGLFRTEVDDVWNGVILLLLGAMQTVVAFSCGTFPVVVTLLLAATIGAFAAHGIQALTHEMCHSVGKNGGRVKLFGVGVGNAITRLACATTNFPWSMYYEQYHTKHHAYTGSQLDADGIILFRWWHEPPVPIFSSTRWGKVLWSGIYATLLYPMFCVRKKLLDVAHPLSLNYEGLALAYQLAVFLFGGGGWGLLYIHMSAAFSLGALCHPYWGFWLIQHMPNEDGSQLTLSYTGSRLWHILNFGELYHVEHHDFPRIPWTRLHRCQEIAPEFYRNLHGRDSITGVIREWVEMDNAEWMRRYGDFAGWFSHMKRKGMM